MKKFDKYELAGAYHWEQTNPQWNNGQFNAPLTARYQALIDLLPASTSSVLDVGCGDGYLLYLAALKTNNVALHGIDDNQLAIDLAKKKLQDHGLYASLTVASAYSLPFEDQSFNAVLNADVIEHLKDADNLLKEIKRVLKPGGLLLLSTPHRQSNSMWDKYHIREFDADEISTLCGSYFTKVNVHGCWPMWWFEQFKVGGYRRRIINLITRLGFNPFLFRTDAPNADYGQLIVRCIK